MVEITGSDLIDILATAGYHLKNNSKKIDDLNVFPVPDGDTGSNMSYTFVSGLKALEDLGVNPNVSTVIQKFARGVLYGARGNSGVILSQFFAGLASTAGKLKKAKIKDIMVSLDAGCEYAYKAVVNPVEGTILTVIKDATKAIKKNRIKIETVEQLASIYDKALSKSLDNTPNLLPVLKEAGVVDSGAAGINELVKGVKSYFEEGERHQVSDVLELQGKCQQIINFDSYDYYTLNTYGYCTEFTLKLNPDKEFDKEEFTKKLEVFGGSMVVVKEDDILKAHIHTKTPGDVFSFAQQYGALCLVKADNMAVQTEENSSLAAKKVKKETSQKSFKEKVPYAIISVLNGKGLKEIFTELGASVIIDGGQTMNPSTEDFIKAVNKVNADDIYIIPNNKNVLLSAKQAKALINDKHIVIVPAKTIPQGYASLLAFDGSEKASNNVKEMEAKIKSIRSGEVTYATRNSVSSGLEIHKGDYISILDGQIINSVQSRFDSAKDLVSSMITNESYMLTLFYGIGVKEEEINELQQFINETYPDIEVQIFDGGQKIYSYIIEVE